MSYGFLCTEIIIRFEAGKIKSPKYSVDSLINTKLASIITAYTKSRQQVVLFLAAVSVETRDQTLPRAFLQTCDDIGVPMAPEKTVGPSFVLSFADIELHTLKMEARLSEDKLAKRRSLTRGFLPRKKVTLTELQSLIGLLNFTCSVIVAGRTMGEIFPGAHFHLIAERQTSPRADGDVADMTYRRFVRIRL